MSRVRTVCSFAVTLLVPAAAVAEVVPVTSSTELVAAINNAVAGDEITLAAGTYRIDSNVRCNASGEDGAPIVVRAEQLGDAVIEFDTVEGFVVAGAHWHFENLEVRGVCAADSDCEHAFHVVGPADDTIIRNNRVVNFNAHVKSNGSGDPREWPDRGLIEANEFYNEAIRQTGNPVTPLDLVGGDDWMIRRNFIHDFAKGQGNSISYAAFLKGKSRRGVFERNLVACEHLHTGQIRLGLSFGGGGTGDQFCEGGTCTPEHIDGVMQNNIIANCPADVGIYINEGENTLIQFNTLYNNLGIDVRFDATTAVVVNNVLDGRVRDRNGGTSTQAGNLTLSKAELEALFANPAALDFGPADPSALQDAADSAYTVADDYCGKVRGANQDIGAIEYDGTVCDTTTPFATEESAGEDMGMSADMGPQTPDAGPGHLADMSTGGGGDVGGIPDVTTPDADAGGSPDAGSQETTTPDEGCSCSQSGGGGVLWPALLLGLLKRRRR